MSGDEFKAKLDEFFSFVLEKTSEDDVKGHIEENSTLLKDLCKWTESN